MTRVVFLDRDGVLNHCRPADGDGPPLPPRSLDQLALMPGVREACRLLKDRGYRLVVVTNQPDVARRTQSRAAVEAINAWLADVLDLDEVCVCWHDDEDRCDCRKPEYGLLKRGAAQFGANLDDCYMVGDRWRDIEAGNRAGCTTALVGGGYGETLRSTPAFRGESLLAVAKWIAARDTDGRDGLPLAPALFSTTQKGDQNVNV